MIQAKEGIDELVPAVARVEVGVGSLLSTVRFLFSLRGLIHPVDQCVK